jgi:hypothetical protein
MMTASNPLLEMADYADDAHGLNFITMDYSGPSVIAWA